MRITDVIRADPHARAYHKARTLLATIQRRLDFYSRRMSWRLTGVHLVRSSKAIEELKNMIENSDWEINSSLSSREILKKPVKETVGEIFENLPEPSKRQYNDFEKELIKTMNETGVSQRTATYRTLLAYEIAWAAYHKKFMLFTTLTIQNGKMDETFSKESKVFKNYIRKFTQTLPKTNKTEQEHTYFACVEAGTKTGRLHIHIIHFFEKLPAEADDPNRGREKPNHWEITHFKQLWDYGWIVPKMVRYNPNDAYGILKWRWPLDRKTGLPYEIGSPQRLSSYMSKYINMTYDDPRRSKYLWRIRKSHNLGMKLIEELLSTLTLQDLLNIATNDAITAKLNRQKIPPQMLRIQALKLFNQKSQNQQYTEKTKSYLCKMVPNIASRPQPLQSSQGSIRELQTNNQQNIGITRIATTNPEDTFNETIQKLTKKAEQLNQKYFAEPWGAYGTTTTQDYLYQ